MDLQFFFPQLKKRPNPKVFIKVSKRNKNETA